MSEDERKEARKALIQWFDSQGIMPGDASIIMFDLVAEQLVLKTHDRVALSKAIQLQMQYLAIGVASELEKVR